MKIENLSFSYDKKEIFNNLNVEFADDKLNIILGPNGTGKTTLLDSISGIQTDDLSNNFMDFPEQKQMAYKSQQLHFFPSVNVQQTVQMYNEIDHNRENLIMTSTMQKIYNQVIEKIEQEKVGKLSGGEKQIVLNYCTCLLTRELYLFDEPLSGVDINNAQLIIQLLSSLVTEKHKKVILTSHDIELFKEFPIYIIVLNHKECVFTGSYQELLRLTKENHINNALRRILA